jgi:hypothetical protein
VAAAQPEPSAACSLPASTGAGGDLGIGQGDAAIVPLVDVSL